MEKRLRNAALGCDRQYINFDWFSRSVIRLGELNLNPRVADGAKPIDFPVARILKHQQYNPKTIVNDIALIKLEKTVTFNGKYF